MENKGQPVAEETSENGLWITDTQLSNLLKTARLGKPLMAICTLLALSAAAMSLLDFWMWAQWQSGGFYLFEGSNLFYISNFALSLLALLFFTLAILEGKKIWPLLKICDQDDDALLEGTERMAKMFRWLFYWGGAVLVSIVLKYLLDT